MNNINELYNLWLEKATADPDLKKELLGVKGNDDEVLDRFYRSLEFGTAGLRGVIGAGTNRMNYYTVGRATQGLADFLNKHFENPSIAIGYDSRIKSEYFSVEAAKTLAANGIKVYLYEELEPTPCLSFAIRHFKTSSGIILTASHNPAKYNGYKCYNENGYQMTDEEASETYDFIQKVDYFTGIKTMDFDEAKEKGLLEIVSSDLDEKFLDVVQTQQQNPEAVAEVADTFKLIYTPFHGTGSRPIKAILNRMGFKNVLVVKEQDTEDGNFPTVKSPNPEDKEGFEIAIKMAKENDVDVIIGTDPDCDRVGIVVRDADGIYRTLTGNQTGALLVEYILSSKKAKGTLPENGVVIKTIVTTELAAAIAHSYGIEIMNVLTGFKYIGEKMTEFAKTGDHTYLIGFEESYGYLVGTHARDKDGVVATMLIAEMAAYYKTKGKSLYEALMDIYKKYGYYSEKTVSFVMPGKDGMEKMSQLLTDLRQTPPTKVAGMDVVLYTDYQSQTIKDTKGNVSPLKGLPKSNVLKYNLSDEKTYFIVRPSGTEPKIKLYLGTFAESFETAEKTIEKVLEDCKKQLGL